MMNCARCGGRLSPVGPRQMSTTIKRIRVHFTVDAPQCVKCGKVALIGKTVDQHARRAADAYRRAIGFWTSADLIAAKNRLRMSWPLFADFVGVSLVQLKRWLAGGS